jgi:hypothetical protein
VLSPFLENQGLSQFNFPDRLSAIARHGFPRTVALAQRRPYDVPFSVSHSLALAGSLAFPEPQSESESSFVPLAFVQSVSLLR